MYIKQVVKWGLPLLMLGILGGCGQGKQSQSQSDSTASSKQVKQSDQSSSESVAPASTSSESVVSTSASNETSAAQSTTSATVTSSKPSADNTQKNTTKSSSASTTTGTVSQASVLNQVYQQLSGQYARQDLLMQVSQNQPGIYTVQVQENHQSANMKSAGVDPSTTPTVAWFQTNQQGQLLRSDNGGASYYVVGKVAQ